MLLLTNLVYLVANSLLDITSTWNKDTRDSLDIPLIMRQTCRKLKLSAKLKVSRKYINYYNSVILGLIKEGNLVSGLTQENLIENSV